MKIFYLLLFSALPLCSVAQKKPDYGLYKVRINDSAKTVLAEVNPVGSMPAVKPTLQYYWYGAAMIHTLQGGVSGKPLNGNYQEFFLNKNLKTQGKFDRGLKNGIWKTWDDRGVLVSSVTWKEGVMSGDFEFFNSDGSLKTRGTYKKNELSGVVYNYAVKDTVKKNRYKNGVLLTDTPRSFFNRVNIFKKKPAKKK